MKINWLYQLVKRRQEKKERKREKRERKAARLEKRREYRDEKIKRENKKALNNAVLELTRQLDQKRMGLRSLTWEEKRSIVLNAQRLNAERFLKDNERIWSVSTLFIPLSLAGLSSLKDKSLFIAILLATASIALITFWYLASEKLRRFQDENLETIKVYNLYLGIDTAVADIKLRFLKPVRKKKNITLLNRITYWHDDFMIFIRDTRIQTARLYMYRFVVILWVLVVAGTITENLLTGSLEIKDRIIPFFHTTFNFSLFR